MAIYVHTFSCLQSNLGIMVHDTQNKTTILIDAPEEKNIKKAIEETGWIPSLILTTHHHSDHTQANLRLKEDFGLKIYTPLSHKKIPGSDKIIQDGDEIDILTKTIKIIATPGHTWDHLSFYLEEEGMLFTGDCLFILGCGRLFECPPNIMFSSVSKLAKLPSQTKLFCGHNYALENAYFAETIDPKNEKIKQRREEFEKYKQNKGVIPKTTLGEECTMNPFLRTNEKLIQSNLGMLNFPEIEIFAEIRKRKDSFS